MYVELWNKPKVTYNCTVSGQMFDYLLALITYNLFIIILFFHRWLRKLVWWMEKQNLHSVRTVSWVYNEPYFLGCPAGGSHTHCTRCALHTQHNESTNRTQKNLCSHFTVLICQVCCDVTKRQFVDGHFTLCEWESVCVCVCVCVFFIFFCFVCVVLVLFMSMVDGRGPHEVTQSTGMTYISFFFFQPQCHCEV